MSTALTRIDISSSYEDNQTPELPPEIAKKETRLIFRLKFLVSFVLIGSALAAALLINFYIRYSERRQFEEQFSEYAEKVMESIVSRTEVTLGALGMLAGGLTAFAESTNQTWPFVYIPDYAFRVSTTLPLSRSVQITMLPLVTADERLQWEGFVADHQYQDIEDTLKIMEIDQNYYGPVDYNCSYHRIIYGDYGDIPYNVTRDLVPSWQNYPNVCGGLYAAHNWDYLSWSDPGVVLNAMKGFVTISQTYMIPGPDDPVGTAEEKAWAEEYYADYIADKEKAYEPLTEIYFPVFDKVPGSNDDPDDKTVGSLLMTTFYWREVFKDILPPGADGVVVVVKGGCVTSPFTFLLDGPTAEYLGPGDLHDRTYDHIGIFSEAKDLTGFNIRKSTYTGPPLDYDYCPNTFHVYPAKTLEDNYTSDDPLIFALGAVAIFLFTSLVFIAYDRSIERRQNLVMRKAKQSTAVVSALFPGEVAERIMQGTDKQASRTPKTIFHQHRRKEELQMTGNEARPYAGKPIADLYPDCTVFFADIVGFTHWSSIRSPEQVFLLLEALYSAFDNIARRRRVFKIETIGDCYVAVCGLPQPRDKHAVVMCRFASDCLLAAARIVKELDNSLGSGTSDLSLRVGLHSGPVTAGVLRGEKGRYQLFGDTVNTASRMESNGIKGRVHVSQATADLLIAEGRSSWLEPREDKIVAKGKGEMQTWFVTVPCSNSVVTRNSDEISDKSLCGHSLVTETVPDLGEDTSTREESKDKFPVVSENGVYEV